MTKIIFISHCLFPTAVNNELAANEARLRSTENENRALQNAIEEASRREAGMCSKHRIAYIRLVEAIPSFH